MPNSMYNMAPMTDPKKIAEAPGEHVGHVETRGGPLGTAQTVADEQGLRGRGQRWSSSRAPATAAVHEYRQAFYAWDSATMSGIRQRDEFLNDKRAATAVWTFEPQHESELLEQVRRTWAALSREAQRVLELELDMQALRLGVYVHHSGGEYTATGFIWHHETQRPMVKYVSHKYGKENARPLRGWPTIDEDGWNECVQKEGLYVPRFRLTKLHSTALYKP